MVKQDKKSRWDFIGREPEPDEDREAEKQPEVKETPTRPEDYSKNRLWQIYDSLPEDLQKTAFSEEVAYFLGDLAQKYGISDRQTKLSELVGYHLLGVLPSNEFKDKLKQDLQLSRDASEALFREVAEIIFNPVRKSLDELYKKGEEDQEAEKEVTGVGTAITHPEDYSKGKLHKEQDTETIALESAPPILELSNKKFEFESVPAGTVRSANFTIANVGGGMLTGEIKTNKPWLEVSRTTIDTTKHKQEVTIYIDTTGMPFGFAETGYVRIQSNAGPYFVSVQVSIEIPEQALSRFRLRVIWLSIIWGTMLGASTDYIHPSNELRENVLGGPVFFLVAVALGRLINEYWGNLDREGIGRWVEFIFGLLIALLPWSLLLALLGLILYGLSFIPFFGPITLFGTTYGLLTFFLSRALFRAIHAGRKYQILFFLLVWSLPTIWMGFFFLLD